MWTKWNCSLIGIYTPFSKMFPQVIGWRCMTWHVFERKVKYLVIYVAVYVAWFTSQDSQVIVLAFYPSLTENKNNTFIDWSPPYLLWASERFLWVGFYVFTQYFIADRLHELVWKFRPLMAKVPNPKEATMKITTKTEFLL